MIAQARINKTIVITFQDGVDMMKFCNPEGHVSREFYDWYLHEKPEFFAEEGMCIVADPKKEKLAISFDFTNPEEAVFCHYLYRDKSVVARWHFKRQENLTMEKISLDIKELHVSNFNRVNNVIIPKDFTKEVLQTLKLAEKGRVNKLGGKNRLFLEQARKRVRDLAYRQAREATFTTITYFIYALMFYVSKIRPEEITEQFQKEITAGEDGEKVKELYKYSGYINLLKNRAYRPAIDRDPDAPVRDYERHIEAWTVRGHYRRTKNGLIWIDPHTKGSGTVEKRIYGTVDEKDLKLIPKTFEVMRTKKKTETDPAPPVYKPIKDDPNPSEIFAPIQQTKSGLRAIINFFINLLKSKS